MTPAEYSAHLDEVVAKAPPLSDAARDLLLRLGVPTRPTTAEEGVAVRVCGKSPAATPDPAGGEAA